MPYSTFPSIASLSSLPSCNYYSVTEFLDEHRKLGNQDVFSIFHVNIRSLNANNAKLYQLMSSLNSAFEIIILSEIWSVNIDHYANLFPNYSFYYTIPVESIVGGVGAFVHNSLSTTVHKIDSNMQRSKFMEVLLLEISKNGYHSILGCFYRHPSFKLSNFLSYLENINQNFFSKFMSNHCFLIGDFNANLLKYDTEKEVAEYLDSILGFNFIPLSTIPTRITETSYTLIDHVFYRTSTDNRNVSIDKAISGCLITDMTDHLANFIMIPINQTCDVKDDRLPVRIFSDANKVKFRNEITAQNWNNLVYDHDDVNVAYANFIEAFSLSYDRCFPLVKVSRKRKKDKKWITSDLIKSCQKKSNLYKKWIVSRDKTDYDTYKCFSNKHNKMIKNAKKSYFFNVFESCKNNAKMLWKQINNLGKLASSKKNTISSISKLVINDLEIKDSIEMASKFNEYFCNIGINLANDLPPINANNNTNYKNYLNQRIQNSFVCDFFTSTEVSNMIVKFKSRKGVGRDGFSAKFVYDYRDIIVSSLCYIFNLSLDTGIFPSALKIAKTIPIPKTNDNKSSLSNYRPISLLSIFSKIFESLFSARLSSFLNKYNILYDHQYGFRPKYSTKLA